LKRCFDSLFELDYPKNKLEIIMVDNKSKDGSVLLVKNNHEQVKIVKLKDNNYCKALNEGIKNSSGKFVAFLNNDTKVESRWLVELVAVISADEKIGAVGSKILFFNKRINSTGILEFPNFYINHKGFNEKDDGQYDKTQRVDCLSGASILFRRECLDDVGFFDEDFVFYYDEVDYARRCRDKWDLIFVPESVVYHEYAGTIGADSKMFKYYVERNRLLFVAKHHPEKLAAAISSSHLFYKNIQVEHELLFDIMPDVLKKLVKENEKEELQLVLPQLFKELRKIIDFEKYDYLKGLLGENKTLKTSLKRMEVELKRKEAVLKRKDVELKKKDADLKRVYNSRAYKWFISRVWNVHSKLFKQK